MILLQQKQTIVQMICSRFLHSDLVRQLQCLNFKILIVPFHCPSSSLFRQFWHCTFIVSLQILTIDFNSVTFTPIQWLQAVWA